MAGKKAQRKQTKRRTGALPEPARSVAKQVKGELAETEGKGEAEQRAVEQAEEWTHSRAPGGRAHRARSETP